MRVDEFAASRIVEAVVHGIDLTQALGRAPIATAEGIAATATILDDLLARRTIPGRRSELSDDLEWILDPGSLRPSRIRRQQAPAHRLSADRGRPRHRAHLRLRGSVTRMTAAPCASEGQPATLASLRRQAGCCT